MRSHRYRPSFRIIHIVQMRLPRSQSSCLKTNTGFDGLDDISSSQRSQLQSYSSRTQRRPPPPDIRHRLSMATAYAGLIFLAASLWFGPWNVLRRLPNPISFNLRRDVGIWTGILAIVHTAIGLTVHLRGRMWMYFFKRLHPFTLQK